MSLINGIFTVGSTLDGRFAVVPFDPVHTRRSHTLKSVANRFSAIPIMIGSAFIFIVKNASTSASTTPTPITPRRPSHALLNNALKYTPSGTVTIYKKEPQTLCIKDTGIGIAPEDLPRIFEKGYTGSNGRADKKASGIGLYLCRRICTNLGHKITVHSVPGEGTEVCICLERVDLEIE